ncbi:MAG: hypothetical protein ACQESP_09475 [Candidatus Muiribacteriota bacterium]
MKISKMFVIISLITGMLILTSASEVSEIRKNLKETPHVAENHFMMALVYYFEEDFSNALEHFITSFRLNRKILENKDYGMLDKLSNYVRNQALYSNDFDLKFNGALFLRITGYSNYAQKELKKMLMRENSAENKQRILRIINSMSFLETM